MSNDRVVTATKRSSLPSPIARRNEASRFVTARCSMPTPLGRPVEPEVKMM